MDNYSETTIKIPGSSTVEGMNGENYVDDTPAQNESASGKSADDTPPADEAIKDCTVNNGDNKSADINTGDKKSKETFVHNGDSANPAQDFQLEFTDCHEGADNVDMALIFLQNWFDGVTKGYSRLSFVNQSQISSVNEDFSVGKVSELKNLLTEKFASTKPVETKFYVDARSDKQTETHKSEIQIGFVVNILFADYFSGDEIKLCPDIDTARAAVENFARKFNLLPTYIVDVASGIQVYWRFSTPRVEDTDFDNDNRVSRFTKFFSEQTGFKIVGGHTTFGKIPGSLVFYRLRGSDLQIAQSKLIFISPFEPNITADDIDALLNDGVIPPPIDDSSLDDCHFVDAQDVDSDSADFFDSDSADNQSLTVSDKSRGEKLLEVEEEFIDESHFATDTATLLSHVDSALNLALDHKQDEATRFYTTLLISLKNQINNTELDEWIVDTSRWQAANIGSTFKLEKILQDAKITASLEIATDDFNPDCQFERWFVEDLAEADIFVYQITDYLLPTAADKGNLSLKEQLQQAKDKLDSLLAESASAREKLKDVQTFGNDVIYSDEFLTAAAFAKVDDDFAYKSILSEIRRFRDIHKTDLKISDWKNAVKERAKKYQAEIAQLKIDIQSIKAKESEEYFRQKTGETYLSRVEDYVINYYGIMQYPRDSPPRPICRAGVILAEKVIGYETKIIQYVLRVWTSHANSFLLPPVNAESLFNAASLLKLANYGLPVTTRNATRMTDFLDAYRHAVELKDNLKTRYTVSRCGWHLINGKDIIADKYVFVDPRREVTVELPMVNQGLISYSVGLKTFNLSVDTSSQFAQNLQIKGSLAEWKKAYDIAKQYPVARLVIAAAVSTAFLAILRERNSFLYIYGRSRGGKTTALKIAASTIGNERVFRTFDGTKNGLAGAAADVNDYPFLLDEKQSIENKLTEQLENLVHALTDGVGRTRLNRNAAVRDVATWRTNVIATGETPLFESYHNEGVNTRSISIHAPNVIIPASDCAAISDIIKGNFGLIYPLIIDKIMQFDAGIWKEKFVTLQKLIAGLEGNLLNEHNRFLSLYLLGDIVLNLILGESASAAKAGAVELAKNILPLVPLQSEFDKTQDAIDFVDAFVAENQTNFVMGNFKPYGKIFGQIIEHSNRIYIIKAALQDACRAAGRNCDKLVDDLISAGRIEPSQKIERDRKKTRKEQVQKISNKPARCYVYLGTLYTEQDKDSDD